MNNGSYCPKPPTTKLQKRPAGQYCGQDRDGGSANGDAHYFNGASMNTFI